MVEKVSARHKEESMNCFNTILGNIKDNDNVIRVNGVHKDVLICSQNVCGERIQFTHNYPPQTDNGNEDDIPTVTPAAFNNNLQSTATTRTTCFTHQQQTPSLQICQFNSQQQEHYKRSKLKIICTKCHLFQKDETTDRILM